MEYLSSQCCVCLELTSDAERITNRDRENSQWITKLQNVVPEVTWMEYYTICKSCIHNLDVAYEFRALCLEAFRNMQDRKTNILPAVKDNSEIKNANCSQTIQPKKEIKVEETDFSEQVEDAKMDIELTQFPEEVKIEAVQEIKTEPTQLYDDVTKFSCQICNLQLESAKKIVEHCIIKHSLDKKDVKAYNCDECSSRFVSSTKLKKHKEYHNGIGNYSCDICAMRFITKKHLREHKYTHLNQNQNYMCDICKRSFDTNLDLYSHKRFVHKWHTKKDICDEPFICHICNKSFVNQNELSWHSVSHLEKKYVCELCEVGFRTKNELDKHLKRHSAVGLCDVKFSNQYYQKQHLESVHSAKEASGSVKL